MEAREDVHHQENHLLPAVGTLLIRWVPFESLLGAVQVHSFQGTLPQTPGYFFPT